MPPGIANPEYKCLLLYRLPISRLNERMWDDIRKQVAVRLADRKPFPPAALGSSHYALRRDTRVWSLRWGGTDTGRKRSAHELDADVKVPIGGSAAVAYSAEREFGGFVEELELDGEPLPLVK